MPLGTQIAQTTCFPLRKAGGFLLVEAPAPSPGEQYLFWYAALRTAATRSKITDDRKKRSPPKLVLKKVTVYRSQDNELSIQLYPNLPK